MNTLSLEIITPAKIAYTDNNVLAVNVPGADGYLGILPNHTPLFAKLTEGEIRITSSKEEIYLSIGGGFIEVNNNNVTVLVTRAVHAREINEKEALEAQKRAEELLKQKPTGEALSQAQSLYRRSIVDLKLIKRRHRPSSAPFIDRVE